MRHRTLQFVMQYRPAQWLCLAVALVLAALAVQQAVQVSPVQASSVNTSAQTLGSLRGEAAIAELKRDGSFDSLSAAMAAARTNSYHAKPRQASNGYQFANSRQSLSATIEAGALRVTADGSQSSQTTFKLRGVGYGSRLLGVQPSTATARDNRVEYEHKIQSADQPVIREWFVNTPAGIEHGFTLAAAPAGSKGDDQLRVELEISGGRIPQLNADTQTVALADGLSYSQLHVYDARHRELPAHFELNNRRLALVVEDRAAEYPLTIDPLFAQQAKLTAADAAAGDSFGSAVALDGNTAIIGAANDDGSGVDQGSAYVFVRNGSTWTQQAKLVAVDGAASDLFGTAVALSGDTAAIGAYQAAGANIRQGAVYVFTRSGATWTQQQKITAGDGATDDQFGFAVSVSGNTLAVGAYFAAITSNLQQGAVYVYTRSGGAWLQQQKLVANDGASGDAFGYAVALDGNTLAVGAIADTIGANPTQGSAYVFVRTGSTWTQQQKLTASDGAGDDAFGVSIALSGNTVIVGALNDDIGTDANRGSAYVFIRTGMSWTQQQKLTAVGGIAEDQFGFSVALNGDVAVVGAITHGSGPNQDRGAAWVFARAGAVWSQQGKLSGKDIVGGDRFGNAVALSGDTILAGAFLDDGTFADQGSVAVFVIRNNTFAQQQQFIASDGAAGARFGGAVALSGDTAVVGAYWDKNGSNFDQGSAYVFVRSGTSWTFQQKLTANDGASGDTFGFAVAINGDTLVVGAIGDDVGANVNQGSAYLFVRSGAVWTQQQKLTANDGAASDRFGFSLALNSDTLVVGAAADTIGANSEQGAAYVFGRNGLNWTQQQKLTAADGAAGDQLGSSVALSGDTVIAGAIRDDIGANSNQGSAYVFVRSGAVWSQQQKITVGGTTEDLFGYSVALNDDTAAVGNWRGVAFVFIRNGTTWSHQQQFSVGTTITSVALGNDILAVGSHEETVGANLKQGAVYLFTRSGTSWTQLLPKLTASDGAANDGFGFSVALNGDTAVVGAIAKKIGANDFQGAAYVFVSPACPTITLTPAILPNGSVGASYNQQITASGGTGTYQFSLSGGTLPPGLSLAQNGLLSDTPMTAGTYSFTVTASTNGSLCPGSRSYTMVVTASCSTITVNPASLPNGATGAMYSQTLTASGGTAPYSFSVSAGALPNGIALSAVGMLSGTPTVPGSFNFTVMATDAIGCTGTRAYSVTITGGGGGSTGLQFYPLPFPIRLLDTRAGQPGCDAPGAMISGGTSRTQTAAGRTCSGLTIPANAKALAGNITTVQSGGGYLTLYPSDAQQPLVANSNFGANEILNNVFTVGLGADGAFKIFVTSNTDVVVDVTGYYAPPSASGLYFHPLPRPIRVLETRAGQPGCTTPGVPIQGSFDQAQMATITCNGVTIPSSAKAIVGNATSLNSGSGFLTLYPQGASRPLVASSNFTAGQIMNAPFTVALGATGEFMIYSTTNTDLVVDVLGYYSDQLNDANGTGLLFNPLPAPVRLLETRAGQSGCYTPGAPLAANSIRNQQARGACGGQTIANNALAIVGNATVVTPAAGGYLTFWPNGASQPLVATTNFTSGQIFNRHFTVGLGATGMFNIFAFAQTDLVIDVSGYFAP